MGRERTQAIWVGELDLVDPPSPLVGGAVDPGGSPYRLARLLVRFRAEPLGLLTVPVVDGEIDADATWGRAADRFRHRIERLGGLGPASGPGGGRPPASDAGGHPESARAEAVSDELWQVVEGDGPAVSVVIGTRNRPDHVVECVQRVLKQRYPSAVEVIVVDNGSADSSTSRAIESAFAGDGRVRYMTEVRPGLSRARNIGLSAARYPVVAFLSDDIRVDPLWLAAIARGFARHAGVRCVTGICPPAYLDTAEQLMFESAMSWGSRQGFEPVVHRYDSADDRLHPYRIGSIANGSNMAYQTEAFRRMGGFDEALGPGTRARGGEDLDAPIRILAAGHLVAFEPAAIGWHADRYDDRPFSRLMYTYGLGLTAFLTKHSLDRELRAGVLRRIIPGLPLLINGFDKPRSADDDDGHGDPRTDGDDQRASSPLDPTIPVRYRLWHLLGRLAGPFAYLRSRMSRLR